MRVKDITNDYLVDKIKFFNEIGQLLVEYSDGATILFESRDSESLGHLAATYFVVGKSPLAVCCSNPDECLCGMMGNVKIHRYKALFDHLEENGL